MFCLITFEIELDEGGLGKPFEVENGAILLKELFALVHILWDDNTNGLENLWSTLIMLLEVYEGSKQTEP